MSTHEGPEADTDTDPHVVTSAALRHLVDLARSQPVPPRRRSAESLHAAFLVARQARRRRLATYAAASVALAAALAALVVTRLDLSIRTGPMDHVTQDMRPGPAEAAPLAATPTLTAAARVSTASAATPSPTVLGPWEVALAPGRYDVEVDAHPGAEALLLRAPGGALELHHGRVMMIVGASHTEVALQTGVGVWVAADGRRDALTPSPAATLTPAPEGPAAGTSTGPSAHSPAEGPSAHSPAEGPSALEVSALARRAEELLTSGKRDAAIKLLSQIVTAHPEHPAARAALLDLAPLLAAAGRVDEARCAYRLYLARYPGKPQLADQVEKALARLGEGRKCRGLKPN